MVKTLLLGLLASIVCAFMYAAGGQAAALHQHYSAGQSNTSSTTTTPPPPDAATAEDLTLEDPAARSERSTNLSHVTGASRKIQMFIKNRHLQLLPDGTINGTTDDTSVYTLFQRTTVGIGQMKIQGVATCQYLCMDSCGWLYGSRDIGDECVFKETIEQHNYNTYSSSKYSNKRRTLYIALNRRGQPKKVVLQSNHQLGKLSSYTRVLTRTVASEQELQLPPMRHHAHLCPISNHHPQQTGHKSAADPQRCRKRKKRKKKKRKCEDSDTECQKKPKCEDTDECPKKKPLPPVQKKKKKLRKGARKRVETPTSSTPPSTTTLILQDEMDYTLDTSTHFDGDDFTPLPPLEPKSPQAAQLIASNNNNNNDDDDEEDDD